MRDRFDFLEFGDKPSPTPAEAEPGGDGVGVLQDSAEENTSVWKQGRLRAVEIIGDPGTAHGQFANPAGLAVDRFGAVYVADTGNHRVQRIGMNGELKVYGRPGSAPGEMWQPTAVAVDPSGDFFFVAEQGNQRVQCFQINGQHRGVMNGFRNPSGVAVDVMGRLWIADTGNGRVLCWDGRNRAYGPPLDAAAGVLSPIAVACDAAHNLYVTEGMSEEVSYFANYSLRNGSLGANRKLYSPQQTAIDGLGRIYLSEAGADRLHVLSSEGESIVTFDTLSTRMGSLKSPLGVALGPNLEVYVADTGNHRVVRLAWE